MFYGQDLIAGLLKCAFCQQRFDDTIKCLPCGESICMKCVENLELGVTEADAAATEFRCRACEQSHEVPKGGLITNVKLMRLLSARPIEVYRGKHVEQLKRQLDELKTASCELRAKVRNCQSTVQDYCDNIRMEVDFVTASALDHINALNKRLHERVSEYEDELLESLKGGGESLSGFRAEFEQLSSQCEEFNLSWTRELNQPVLNEDDVKSAKEKAADMKQQVDKALGSVRDLIFKQRYLDFETNRAFVDKQDYLGQLSVTCPDSTNNADKTIDTSPTKVMSLVALANGDLVGGCSDKSVKVWNSNTGKVKRVLTGHDDWVRAVCVLPENKLASGADDRTIRVWCLGKWKALRSLSGHSSWIYSLAALGGRELASGSWDHAIKIWDFMDGVLLRTLTGHEATVCDLVLLSNGHLVSCANDKTIKVWNPRSEQALVRTLVGHTENVFALAVLKSGELASGSLDCTINIWNPEDGSLVRSLVDKSQTDGVISLAALENGDLAAGSSDHIRIWNPKNGSLKRKLIAHRNNVNSIALMHNGDFVSASDDETIKIWNHKYFRVDSASTSITTNTNATKPQPSS